MENKFKEVIDAVSNLIGDDYFNKITLALNKAISSDYTFIAKLDKSNLTSETISLVSENKIINNFTYDLKDTPCNEITDTTHCCYPNKVCQYFPKDQLLIDMNIEGYIGSPLLNSNGELIGIIVALYHNKIKNESEVLSLFKLFSGRIAAELERKEQEIKLKDLNNKLDLKVKERTIELENTILNLKNTQKKLIESEKMASIGLLVSGIAHEVNTPLGISITSSSIIEEQVLSIKKALSEDKLSLAKLNTNLSNIEQASVLLDNNLKKSKDLVDNFKKTSVELYNYSKENINLKTYIENFIKVIKYQIRDIDISVLGGDFYIDTYSTVHFQVLSNLIYNTNLHAYDNKKNMHIIIEIKKNKNKITINYKDNGKGIKKEHFSKLFSPFFTTNRSNGSSGLGLYIIYNLVTQKLSGNIKINNKKHFDLTYSFDT